MVLSKRALSLFYFPFYFCWNSFCLPIFQQLFIGRSFASIIESKTFTRKCPTSRSLSTCASSRCGWLFEVHSCFIFQSSNLILCPQQHCNILTSRHHFGNICPFLYTPAVHFSSNFWFQTLIEEPPYRKFHKPRCKCSISEPDHRIPIQA